MPTKPDTKTAHTPGPWAVATVSDIDLDPPTDCMGEAPWAIVQDESGLSVADLWFGAGLEGEIGAEQAEANARLIAAAPDLLAALKALRDCPAISDEDFNDPEWGDGETSAALTLALDAIALAEGGAK